MNTDIRIHIEFWSHAKTRRMIRVLGLQGPVSLQILWCYTAKNRASGVLRDMDADDIEEAAGWPSDRRGEFFAYCTKHGWLDRAGRGVWSVHEWQKYNPWAAEAPARAEDGRRGAHERYHTKRGLTKPDCQYCREAMDTLQGGHGHTTAPAPAPSPAPSPLPSPAPVAEREKETPPTRGRAEVTPQKESWLRQKVREMRLNAALIEMARHAPNDYIEAVRDQTGYSPDELADMLGDDAIRPHRESAA